MEEQQKTLNITFSSTLTDLCERNSSFDSATLRIAYPGVNANKCSIEKSVFEKCMGTIYNCPIVCNYMRDEDKLGGHDIELVRDDEDDSIKIVNITTPVGCVPESARTYWKEIEEKDGTKREYLCADVLLWKRQEAYRKIKKDGITAQSMEIKIKDGKLVNGIYEIYDFEFTAFALIGETPCFESAALEFSKHEFKKQLSQMMQEIKNNFTEGVTSKEDDIKFSLEGGKRVVEEKNKLIKEYGIDADSLDFSIDELTTEELKEKLENIKADKTFSLAEELKKELQSSVREEKIQKQWGEMSRYCYVDFDEEKHEVYCLDSEDWLLYGFTYTVAEDGDSYVINWETKTHKKYVIVDFAENEKAEDVSPIKDAVSAIEEAADGKTALADELEETKKALAEKEEAFVSLEKEVEELRKFKAGIEEEKKKQERENVFSKFSDLEGVEAFEQLREGTDLDISALEEKCFALRGRNVVVKSEADSDRKATKLIVDKSNVSAEPYGGIFFKYGINK